MAKRGPRKVVAAVGKGSRLSDLAYVRIFEIVYERRLPMGAFVSQAELAELTGVPVAPLRDALRTLEAEGVLTIHPHAGIQFIKPGMELARSTYQFRGIIEAAAGSFRGDRAQ
jgi:DNA-binding GntR family transcriptional regulator